MLFLKKDFKNALVVLGRGPIVGYNDVFSQKRSIGNIQIILIENNWFNF